MSRRFGRNQKRRMREELAAKQERVANLETGMAMDRGLLREQSQKLASLKEMMGEFAERVGRYAIAHDVPTEFQSRNLDLRREPNFRMHAMPAMQLASYGSRSMPDILQMHDEVMAVLDVQVVRDAMSRDLHCRLYFDGHRIGYAISYHALRGLTRAELVRRITPEIAYHLEAELKREGIR